MPWLAAPVGALLRGFHNRSDLTTVPTSALKHELSARGFRRLRVLGRGVDAQLFDPARRCDQLRASWGADPTTPVILCVGRLAAEKNLGLLIKAYESMSSSIGDGPLRDSLAAQCPTAIFAGRQSGVELARHYASADLFLFPSLSETFGNVVTESMASGLATVAFRHAAAAELIVNGSNGVLIEPTEPDSFVKASRDLAADWARCRAMGQLARQSVAHLDWPAIAEQFEAMIFSLIEGEKPASTVLPVSRLRASGTRAA
jgi:glycosyltransferase involved in cell wall biosynthesis